MKTRSSGTNRARGLILFLICIFGSMPGQRAVTTFSSSSDRINVSAVSVNPSNIFIADVNAFGGGGGIIRVNSTTDMQATVSSGGIFVEPIGIAIDANGDLIVADWPAFGGAGIVRVNPATGAQTVISSGGSLFTPTGIAINASGDILVADDDAFGGGGGIIRVNPVTGSQATVSSGGFFDNPRGIAIDANGDLIVVDRDAFGGPGGVIRVNPVTGAQSMIASGGSFDSPSGIAIEANGNILVADHSAFGGSGGVIRVNSVTGAQTTVSSGGVFDAPFGIAVEANGNIVVTDHHAFGGPGGVIQVDPVTGAQTTISSGGSFVDPVGIAISPAMHGCVQPPLGTVSWWPGDGNADDIKGPNDGTLQNGAAFASGFVQQAFSFNGSGSYVELPDSASLQLTGAVSVDFWVYPTEHLVSGIVTKIDNAEEGAGWHVGYYGTNLPSSVDPQHVVFTINESFTTYTSVSSSANSVPFNNWTHIAATSDGTTMRLYINGIQVDSAASPTVLPDSFTTLFGAYQRNGIKEQFFNGLVDEIEIFNHALTVSEIQAIFRAGSAGKCKDSDSDGVPDSADQCSSSNISPTVVIGQCDTGVPNSVFQNGCTISDRIQQCAAGAQNHDEFVSCVAHRTNELNRTGIITGQQKSAIQRCAAQAIIE